jgi:hypothetical protein
MANPAPADFQPRDERREAFHGACQTAKRLFRALNEDGPESAPGTHRSLGRHCAFGCTFRTDVVVTADCRLLLTTIVADHDGGGSRLLDPSQPFDELVEDANEWLMGAQGAMLKAILSHRPDAA